MPVSPLKKLVLPATVLAGTVFSSLTVPLAVFGSEPINIQLNQETVFSGKIKDLAAPYVGVVGVLSIGTGIAGVAIAGWQQASRKFGQTEATLSDLQQKLEAKEHQLEAMMLSDKRLETSGLDFFLQDESVGIAPSATETELKPVVNEVKVPVVASRTHATPFTEAALDPETNQAAVQSVVSTLAAAQAFLSFSRSNGSLPAGYDTQTMVKESSDPNISLQELQAQLKQIMSQVETLRSSLEADSQPALKQAHPSDYTVNTLEHLHHRPAAKPQWVMQPVAS